LMIAERSKAEIYPFGGRLAYLFLICIRHLLTVVDRVSPCECGRLCDGR